jgi:ApaG protein
VIAELDGLKVTVDKIVYSPHLDAPMDRPFPFVYHISIHNDSDVTVTIRGRKWVVTEEDGTCVVVEGDGVVGKFPRLEPGERFCYSSYHVIASDSVVEGAYLAAIEDGGRALVRIPRFELKRPV